MAIAGNPKKLVQDIADGFITMSPPMLKQYTPADIKVILNNMAIVTRDLRQQIVAQDDVMAIKMRNMKMSRLNQASIIICSYCKKKRIPC